MTISKMPRRPPLPQPHRYDAELGVRGVFRSHVPGSGTGHITEGDGVYSYGSCWKR